MELRGLLAYQIPVTEADRSELEIVVPADWSALAVGKAFDAQAQAYFYDHVVADPETERRDMYLERIRPPLAIGHVAFSGEIWLPDAARDAGMIVNDGRRLYERRMANLREEAAFGHEIVAGVKHSVERIIPKPEYL